MTKKIILKNLIATAAAVGVCFVMLVVAVSPSRPATAQSACCITTGITIGPPSSCPQGMCVVTYGTFSGGDSCDSNDKTPAEANECKVKYWQARADIAQSRVTEAEKELDHAKDRIAAFRAAQK